MSSAPAAPLPIKNVESYYTPTQVLEYLRFIDFTPLPLLDDAHDNLHGFEPTLDNLETLMRLHVIAFPYENLEMH